MSLPKLRPGEPIAYGSLGIQRRLEVIRRRVALEGRSLLDVGCGNGAQTLAFLEHVGWCEAIDVDPGLLALFQDKVLEGGLSHCSLHQMDAQALDFPDQVFDVITAIEVLEHVPDHHRTLDEMFRVLKPGGWLALSVPNRWWPLETHGAALPLLPWNRVPFFSWLPRALHDRYAHARIYTGGQVKGLVAEHGFQVRHSEYLMPPLDKLGHQGLRRLLRRFLFPLEKTPLGIFGVSVFVFAQRPLGQEAHAHD
ncbi:MAG: methyltransferase domain-containing protein [Chloroflexota bacterium]